MKIKANPSSLCSKDATRYAVQWPILDLSDAAKPVVYATDGKVLVVLPASDVMPDETSGPIPKEALRDAFKAKGVNKGRVEANGKAVIPGTGATYVRDGLESSRPDWRQVTPKDNTFTICIDAELLASLQKVLVAASFGGMVGVQLSIATDPDGKVDDSCPILVRALSPAAGPTDGTAPFGIIMPIGAN